jgi:hypothetical protein
MTIREIPRSFEYTCDGCGETHVQQNAHGHYHNSRPPEWAGLSLVRQRLCHEWQSLSLAPLPTYRSVRDSCRASRVSPSKPGGRFCWLTQVANPSGSVPEAAHPTTRSIARDQEQGEGFYGCEPTRFSLHVN